MNNADSNHAIFNFILLVIIIIIIRLFALLQTHSP